MGKLGGALSFFRLREQHVVGENHSEEPTATSPHGRAAHVWRVPLTNWQIVLIVLIVIGGRLTLDLGQRIVEGQQKVAQQRQLEAELVALMQERKQLEAAKAYYSSPAFVEDWAHDEGKMVRDGEVLVIPIYEQPAQPAPTLAAPPSTEQAVPPWHVWWTLFFDSPPPAGGSPRP